MHQGFHQCLQFLLAVCRDTDLRQALLSPTGILLNLPFAQGFHPDGIVQSRDRSDLSAGSNCPAFTHRSNSARWASEAWR